MPCCGGYTRFFTDNITTQQKLFCFVLLCFVGCGNTFNNGESECFGLPAMVGDKTFNILLEIFPTVSKVSGDSWKQKLITDT